jgi:hypothetical protein
MNDCVFSKVFTVDFTSEKCEKANTYAVKTIAQEISSLHDKMHYICNKSRYLFLLSFCSNIPYILYLFFSFPAVVYLWFYDYFHIFCIYLFKCKNVISFHILSIPTPTFFLTCEQPVDRIWTETRSIFLDTQRKRFRVVPVPASFTHLSLGLGFCPITQTMDERTLKIPIPKCRLYWSFLFGVMKQFCRFWILVRNRV